MKRTVQIVWVAALSSVIAVSVTLVLCLAPVSRPFSLTQSYISEFECAGIVPPGGARVDFSWVVPSLGHFEVLSCGCNYNPGLQPGTCQTSSVYQAIGNHGSGTFVADGGIYELGTICVGPPATANECSGSNVSGEVLYPVIRI